MSTSDGQHGVYFNRYESLHENPRGPGDSRPTASQILKDEKMEGQLKGKTILITGCSSGLGIETARTLALTGAKIVMPVRNLAKGETALKDLQSTPDVDADQFELLHMDLNSLDSVRKGVKEFLSKHSQLNVLINNAGLGGTSEGRTADGFEIQFGVNHLAHFLLFELLKPTLIASSSPTFQSRVVALSSALHRQSTFDTSDPNMESIKYDPGIAYARSKTANIWFANEIERRYGSSGLHGLSVHPGVIMTGVIDNLDEEHAKAIRAQLNNPTFQTGMKSIPQGAATTVLGAIGRDFEGKGGVYLEECGIYGPANPDSTLWLPGTASYAFNPESEKLLWEQSTQFVGTTAKI